MLLPWRIFLWIFEIGRYEWDWAGIWLPLMGCGGWLPLNLAARCEDCL